MNRIKLFILLVFLTGYTTLITAQSTCLSPDIIASLPFSQTGLTTCGEGDDYTASLICDSPYMNGDDYVFQYTATESGCYDMMLSNTSWAGLFVLDGCPDNSSSNCINFENQDLFDPSPSLNTYLTNGITYYIIISTWALPQCTTFDISIESVDCEPTDCINAFPICSNELLNFNSNGGGNIDFNLSGNEEGCLALGEHQSSWYQIQVGSGLNDDGELAFTIDPVAIDDYDFAIYGPDVACDNLGSPIRCSFASSSSNTGLGNNATDFSEGILGNGFVAPIDVVQGETYYILVDNFSKSFSGFNLTWTGDAVLGCGILPSCDFTAIAGDDIVICSNSSDFNLNGSVTNSSPSLIYTWTAIPTSAISYLSNTNTLNPTFDISSLPTNFSGEIIYTLEASNPNCKSFDNLLIIVDSPNTAPSGTTPIEYCVGDPVAPLTATSSNSGTINWYNTDPSIGSPSSIHTGNSFTPSVGTSSSDDIDNTTAGTISFWITETPIGGCESSDFRIDISFISQPDLAAIPDQVSCTNDFDLSSIAVTDANGLDLSSATITYHNDNSGSIGSAIGNTVTASGQYWIQVDLATCMDAVNFQVTVGEMQLISESEDATCGQQDGQASIAASMGTSPYIYSWNSNPVQTTSIATNLGAGTYTVLVTDANNCTSSEQAIVNVPDIPDAIAINDSPVCEGENVQLSASTTSTSTNIQYSWSGPNNFTSSEQNPILTNTDNTFVGFYDLIITADGCPSPTASTEVVVYDEPDAIANDDIEVCDGATIQLTGSTTSISANLQYNWTGPNNFTSNQQNPTLTNVLPIQSGIYSLIVSANGCPSIPATTNVMIHLSPNIDNGIPLQSSCTGTFDISTIVVTDANATSPTITYHENDTGMVGAILGSNDIEDSGTYWIFAESGICSDSVSVVIDIFDTPIADFTLSETDLCADGISTTTVTFTGTVADASAATFNWDFDGGTIVTGSGAGPYTISWASVGTGSVAVSLGIDENGCLSNVVDESITLQAPLETLTANCSATTPNSVSFDWNDIAGVTDYSISYTIDGATPPIMDNSLVSDYQITGLIPGQIIEITVIALNSGICGNGTPSIVSCTVDDCPVLVPTIDNLATAYCENEALVNLVGTPSGGVFTLNSTVSSTFEPNNIATDTPHTVEYTYTNPVDDCVYTVNQNTIVYTIPTSNFTISETILCADGTSEITVTYTGTVNSTATFDWGFNGAKITSGSGIGPYTISWNNGTGIRNISLTVTQNNCISTTHTETVMLSEPLEIPIVNCVDMGVNNILFDWADVAGAVSYDISYTVNNGSPTNINNVNSTYDVTGLLPNNVVNISVIAVGLPPCGNSEVGITECTVLDCPPLNVNIVNFEEYHCISAAASSLSATPSGGVFSGAGVSGNQMTPFSAGEGDHVLTYIYTTENGCEYSTTTTYTVHPVPMSTFDLNPSYVCADGTSEAIITFTGSIYSNNAVFNWNFNGGTQVSGQAPDPIGVVWDGLSGTANISLSITENGCTSSIETESIILKEPLTAPDVICSETTSSGVSFEWQHIDFAFSYEITYTINNGSPMTLSTFNAYFDVNNLEIGDVVNIEVVPVGDEPCGNGFMGTAECTVEDCPELNISIDNLPESYCSDEGIVILQATPQGGIFSGDGVSDNEFAPSSVDSENANIQYTYIDTSTDCEYNTSANVAIIEVPFAEFEISPNTLCANGSMETIVNFTGTTDLNATPNWDFGGGIAVPGTGFGPHTVTWTDAQSSSEISLIIDNQGCISNTFSEEVMLVAPIEAFEVNCAGTSTTTVSFDWEDVPNVESYEITYSVNGETTNAPIPTFNSEFALNELATNDTIEILVIAIAAEPCGNAEATAMCITSDCPNIALEINNLNESYCSNEASFELLATLEGGIFVGEGIENDNVFNPSIAAIGTNSISYQYTAEESGCEYSIDFEVNVEAPLTTPFVNCVESTQSSITFEWTIIEEAVNYEITYTVNGGNEISETLDNSPFEVTGLSPQDEVNIYVIAIGGGVCGNSETGSSNCVAQDCPSLELSITNLDTNYCNDAPSFAIEAIPTGGVFRIGSTEYIYSNAIFDPTNLGEGQHLVEYVLTEGDCMYSTTAMVEIFAVPNASFEADVSSTCLTDGISISFNGTANATASYDWDFDGGTAENTGQENYTVTWLTSGIKNIRLQVTQNECTSEWFEESIEVIAPLDALIVTCGNSSTNSVSFDWNEIPPYDFQVTYTVNGENPMTTNTSDNSFEVGELTPQDEVEISVIILNDGLCGNSAATTQTCMAEDCVEVDLTINGLESEYCDDATAITLEATPEGGIFYVNDNEFTAFDPAILGEGIHLIEYVLEQGDCNYSTSLSVEVFESLAAVNINCSNSSTSSVSFNWGNLGNYEFELTYAINGENPITSTTTDNNFLVEDLNPQDEVELTVIILNDGICGDSPSASENCIAQDCEVVELSINNVEAIYCSDSENVSLAATPEGGIFYINNEEATIFDPAILGEGTHLIEYLWMQGDCPYSTNVTIEIVVPLEALNINCGENSTDFVSFDWEDLGGEYDFEITYTVNGENPMTETVDSNSFEVNDLNPQDTVEISVFVLNNDICGNSPSSNQICVSQNCEILDLSMEDLDVEYCSDAEAVILAANIEGGIFFVNGDESTTFDPAILGVGTHFVEYILEQNNCSYNVELSVEITESLDAITLNCGNSTPNSVFFNWEDLGGIYDFEVTYTVNGENPMTTTTSDNSFEVNNLTPQDSVEISVIILNDGVCGNSPAISQICVAQDCEILDLNIEGLDAEYCSDVEAIVLTANIEEGIFSINNVESTTFNPSILGEGTHFVVYNLMQGDCSYNADFEVEIVAPLQFINVDCGNATTNSVSFNWEDLGGIYDFEVTYTINGENPIATTISDNSFEVNNLETQDMVELSVIVLNDGICGNSPAVSQTCVAQDCDPLDLSIEGLDAEYCSDAEAVTLTANIEGGTFYMNGAESNLFEPAIWGEGIYLIEYVLEQGDCSYSTDLSVEVVAPLAIPVVNCSENTANSVRFDWEIVEDVSEYHITYLINNQNPIEEILTETGIEIINLSESDRVDIEVIAIGNNLCGNSLPGLQNCTASDCPSIGFDLADSACLGDDISFDLMNGFGDNAQFSWLLSNGEMLELESSGGNSIAWEQAGWQFLFVNVEDENGCMTEAHDSIFVSDFYLQNMVDTTISLGASIKLQGLVKGAYHGVLDYQWTTSDGQLLDCENCVNLSVSPTSPTTYSLLVTDENGCMSNTSVFVEVISGGEVVSENQAVVPNAFSPNGDGINDYFGISALNMASFELVIFNRWGKEMFRTQDENGQWDGRFEEEIQPIGVYAYYVMIRFEDGKEELVRGNLTLVR